MTVAYCLSQNNFCGGGGMFCLVLQRELTATPGPNSFFYVHVFAKKYPRWRLAYPSPNEKSWIHP